MKQSLRAAAEDRRRKWWRRGFTLNTQVDPPGRHWTTHQHDVDEIVCLVEGALDLQIGAELHHAKANKETVIPRLTPHNLSNPGRHQTEYLYGFRSKK